MFEIAKMDSTSVEFKGITFKEGDKVQKIMDICHSWKHMFLEGYPCGRKTRNKLEKRPKKWADAPGVCLTYLVTNDNESHHLKLAILIGNEELLKRQYNKKELAYFVQMYLQRVTDEILKALN